MKLKHDFFLLVCKKKKSNEQDACVCCDQSHMVDVALWNVPPFVVSTGFGNPAHFILHHHVGMTIDGDPACIESGTEAHYHSPV